ncbi:MAG: DUF4176 domain-containing protein [Lachnospiraceae bacterium]|nr:DUF4176 domain-containing protein [Lachnospiraceae bacterium]
MKYNSLLPIGSVVRVQGSEALLLVTGTNVSDPAGNIYDYQACFYPVGFLSEDQLAAFNHTDIEEIYAVGYLDEESRDFQRQAQELNQYLRDREKEKAERGNGSED